ncbi:MAG: SAM-dependent methyltransferase [Nitrospiraceae bacterium]
MSIRLDQTVPFGRSCREYALMFGLDALGDRARTLRFLDCAAGPSSFNAEATAAGWTVTSIDPLYQFAGIDIQRRFALTLDHVIDQVRATPNNWVWSYHRDPDDLRRNRIAAMDRFVADYTQPSAAGRYCCGAVPNLPVAADRFDLALCSHFLFLYSGHFDEAFHVASLIDMLRVAREVRVFPLLTLASVRSPHLAPVRTHLAAAGYDVTIERVPYELQRGGNEMLRVRRL